MILPIVSDKSILNQKSEPVTDFSKLLILVGNLLDTAKATPGTLGLSAVQIGSLERVCLVSDDGKDFKLFINPVIIDSSKYHSTSVESCLSMLGRKFKLLRSNRITVSYTDYITKDYVNESFEGLFARCLAHEIDHTNGLTLEETGKEIF